MLENKTEHLRVLIANERRDRLELLAQVVAGLGHEVIAREIEVREVAAVTAQEHPDVALVGLEVLLGARARADLGNRPRGLLPGNRLALGEAAGR